MQVLFTQIRDFFKSVHPIVKQIFRYGMPTVLGIYAAAGICRMLVGIAGNGDKLLYVSEELCLCGKECFGIIALGGLLLQLFLAAYTYDTNEELFKK